MIATIPTELEGFVASGISSGRYATADEAVAAGLRLLQQRERSGQDSRFELVEARQALLEVMTQQDGSLGELLELRSDGAFTVRGHRVSVFLILKAWRDGLTADAIHDKFPSIASSTIERLAKFAVDRTAAIERLLAVEEAAVGDSCTEATRGPSLDELRSRLAARTVS